MFRREFLKASGLAMAALASSGALTTTACATQKATRPVGLQLFTVLALLEKDFPGTLKTVADIGYKEVETIGSFGRDPREIRDLFDKYGLVSPSQHLTPGNLYEVFSSFTRRSTSSDEIHKRWLEVMTIERVEPIIEEGIARAKILGQQYVVWQIVWPEQIASRALIDSFCKAMNKAGELCKQAGLVFNFHNHAVEFEPVEGVIPYDVIVQNTDPDTVKLELDLYWVTKAGRDPQTYFDNHPGRYRQCHLKDSTPDGEITTVGKGTVDFPKLLASARKAGVEHFYVEYDRAADPMAATRDAYAYLKKLF